jgi:guanylate kinase
MINKKIIISGPSGSGKDFLVREFLKKGLKYLPKFTTRPKRLNETNGLEYNFISKEEFDNLINSDKIKLYQVINILDDIWYYGITTECFLNSELFIMTPDEINQLSSEDINNCYIIYLDIDVKVRERRILKRNDNNDSIKRRIESDRKDFENFSKFNLRITNPEFNIDIIYEKL